MDRITKKTQHHLPLLFIPERRKVEGSAETERRQKVIQASKQQLSAKKMPKELKIPTRNLKAEMHTIITLWSQLSWETVLIFVRTRIWRSA